MSSKSETGHAKNVGNLKAMNSAIETYGQAYNPSNTSIALDALHTLAGEAESTLKEVGAANVSALKAADIRQLIFKPLPALSTRITNALKSCKADKGTIDAAMSLSKKIKGKRIGPTKTDEQKAALAAQGKPTVQISASQRSFDSLIEHFSNLIMLLTETPLYQPNETDLTVDTLNALLQQLTADNDAAVAANNALTAHRIHRDNIIYAPETGIPDTTLAVKAYVKSAFGAASPEFKQISKLAFTRH